MFSKIRLPTSTLAVIFLSVTAAQAADPLVNCREDRLRILATYAGCQLKLASRAVRKGVTASYFTVQYYKCETKYSGKMGDSLDENARECPIYVGGWGESIDAAARDRVLADAAELATLLGGGVSPGLQARKCESRKLKASGKYIACRLKADRAATHKAEQPDYAKCEARFANSWAKAELKAGAGICPSEGDAASTNTRIATISRGISTLAAGDNLWSSSLGTVIDHNCSLEWTTFSDAGGVTDKDNRYTWWAVSTEYLPALNNGNGAGASCFAGYCDWRMPSFSESGCLHFQLDSTDIYTNEPLFPHAHNAGSTWWTSGVLIDVDPDCDPDFGYVCVDEDDFACTAGGPGWGVNGCLAGELKETPLPARAVRGRL